MNSRTAWRNRAAGALSLGLAIITAGCGAGSGPAGRGATGGWLADGSRLVERGLVAMHMAVPREMFVSAPARQLALTLGDLPTGFRVTDELTPTLDAARAADDPWGRRSAYSVTFAGTNTAVWRDVVSSVNAYAAPRLAQAAFASWREAVPVAYRLQPAVAGLGDEAVVYLSGATGPRDGATCLVGLRRGNVLASVSVSGIAGASAPVDAAVALARVMRVRIDAGLSSR